MKPSEFEKIKKLGLATIRKGDVVKLKTIEEIRALLNDNDCSPFTHIDFNFDGMTKFCSKPKIKGLITVYDVEDRGIYNIGNPEVADDWNDDRFLWSWEWLDLEKPAENIDNDWEVTI